MIREIRLNPESIAESDAAMIRDWDLATAPMVVACTRCGAGIGQHYASEVSFGRRYQPLEES